MNPRTRGRLRLALYLSGLAAGCYLVGLAGVVSPVVAHHAVPSDTAVLERIYPDLAARADSPRQLRAMGASRWARTHPAQLERHRQLAYVARLRAVSAPYRAALLCIAGHEAGPEHGGWSANTGNGYYGGLQMDRTFQQSYAPHLYATKGTADQWTREEQLAAAALAVRVRGYTPWPNTARMCGLL